MLYCHLKVTHPVESQLESRAILSQQLLLSLVYIHPFRVYKSRLDGSNLSYLLTESYFVNLAGRQQQNCGRLPEKNIMWNVVSGVSK